MRDAQCLGEGSLVVGNVSRAVLARDGRMELEIEFEGSANLMSRDVDSIALCFVQRDNSYFMSEGGPILVEVQLRSSCADFSPYFDFHS